MGNKPVAPNKQRVCRNTPQRILLKPSEGHSYFHNKTTYGPLAPGRTPYIKPRPKRQPGGLKDLQHEEKREIQSNWKKR